MEGPLFTKAEPPELRWWDGKADAQAFGRQAQALLKYKPLCIWNRSGTVLEHQSSNLYAESFQHTLTLREVLM